MRLAHPLAARSAALAPLCAAAVALLLIGAGDHANAAPPSIAGDAPAPGPAHQASPLAPQILRDDTSATVRAMLQPAYIVYSGDDEQNYVGLQLSADYLSPFGLGVGASITHSYWHYTGSTGNSNRYDAWLLWAYDDVTTTRPLPYLAPAASPAHRSLRKFAAVRTGAISRSAAGDGDGDGGDRSLELILGWSHSWVEDWSMRLSPQSPPSSDASYYDAYIDLLVDPRSEASLASVGMRAGLRGLLFPNVGYGVEAGTSPVIGWYVDLSLGVGFWL